MLRLKLTCPACPDLDGEEVFAVEPEGDGGFKEHESDHYLRLAVAAIQRWQRRGREDSPAPDGQYEIISRASFAR